MTNKFTASEVRRTAAAIEGKQMLVSSMLRAYADRLEADEKAVPVVDDSTIGFCGGRRVSLASMGRDPEVRKKLMDLLDFMNKMESVRNQPTEDTSPPKYDPLHTAGADAERLAEALREQSNQMRMVEIYVADGTVQSTTMQWSDKIITAIGNKIAAHSAQAHPPAASMQDVMDDYREGTQQIRAVLAAQENPR